MAAFVKFWGTRGSIPTPASWTRVYGGNTPCVEVRFDNSIFICDAGSGIRELGKDVALREPHPSEIHLFITHTHWDHIQGFPFFAPAYRKAVQIRVYGDAAQHNSAYRLLSGQMSSDYFPVSFRELGAKIIPDHLEHGEKEIDGVRVRSFPLNHPGGCSGYIFEKANRKIVYATDNEIEIQHGDKFPDLSNDGPLRQVPASLVEAAMGADLLITDAQYNEKEYIGKIGWGHSSCFSVTDWAIKSKVKNLALFHHDPESTDNQLDEKVRLCCERAAKYNAAVSIFAAREGVEFKY
jgi:phosphoribosyl 1,2-cyclic phosphodiesterase